MLHRNGIVLRTAGKPPAVISPELQELAVRRADKLRQLVRLRRAILDLEAQYLEVANEEMELGMRLDHLEAAVRSSP